MAAHLLASLQMTSNDNILLSPLVRNALSSPLPTPSIHDPLKSWTELVNVATKASRHRGCEQKTANVGQQESKCALQQNPNLRTANQEQCCLDIANDLIKQGHWKIVLLLLQCKREAFVNNEAISCHPQYCFNAVCLHCAPFRNRHAMSNFYNVTAWTKQRHTSYFTKANSMSVYFFSSSSSFLDGCRHATCSGNTIRELHNNWTHCKASWFLSGNQPPCTFSLFTFVCITKVGNVLVKH